MKLLQILLLIFSILTNNTLVLAELESQSTLTTDPTKSNLNKKELQGNLDTLQAEITQLEDYYKTSLANLSDALKNELEVYRKALLETTKEKTSLYKKLRQQSQEFLKREKAYKNKIGKIFIQNRDDLYITKTNNSKNKDTKAKYNSDNTDQDTKSAPTNIDKDKQAFINEYKNLLATTKEDVIKEIVEYRKAYIKLNTTRKQLYNALNEELKDFLIQEKTFKKALKEKKNASIQIQKDIKKATN